MSGLDDSVPHALHKDECPNLVECGHGGWMACACLSPLQVAEWDAHLAAKDRRKAEAA